MRQEQSSMFKAICFRQTRQSCLRPGSQESVRFWSRIWDQPVTYNETKWLKKVEKQLKGKAKQKNVTITTDKLKKQLQEGKVVESSWTR